MKNDYKARILTLESKLARCVLLYEKQKTLMKEIGDEIFFTISEIEKLEQEGQIFHWNDAKTFNNKSNGVNE